MLMACYLQNRMPIRPDGKCPEEAFTGRKPSTRHLRTFGCIAYGDIPSVNRDKLEPTARKAILVGYMPTSKQYQLYDPVSKSVFASTSPRFEEDRFWDWSDEPEEDGVDIDILDLMEPVDLDPSELISQFTDRRSPNPRTTLETGGEESQIRPREAADDAVTRPESVTDVEEPTQGNTDDTIVVKRSYDNDQVAAAPVGGRNRPQTGRGASYGDPPAPERRSGQERRPMQFFDQAQVVTDKPKVPLNYQEAVNDPVHGQQWKEAIQDELVKLQVLNT